MRALQGFMCAQSLLCLWGFLGRNTGVGGHFLFQGIFMTQGLNLHLQHWQVDSLPLNHLRSPAHKVFLKLDAFSTFFSQLFQSYSLFNDS